MHTMNQTKRALPMLCDCQRLNGCVEHRDQDASYILWVLHSDASHVVFLHKRWLNSLLYIDGRTTFLQLLQQGKSAEEACKMISRTLLGALKYKPDYVVIVSDQDRADTPLASGLCMQSALDLAQHDRLAIRDLAEGHAGAHNLLGQWLTSLCGVLADRGFFQDPKNRRYRLGA
jgi:hypothetical protein